MNFNSLNHRHFARESSRIKFTLNMKAIFICLFVVLMAHQSLCDSSPLLTGLCNSLDEIPSSLHNTCLLIHCYVDSKGNMTFLQGGCPYFTPCSGEAKMVRDPGAVYPGCCLHPVCD